MGRDGDYASTLIASELGAELLIQGGGLPERPVVVAVAALTVAHGVLDGPQPEAPGRPV